MADIALHLADHHHSLLQTPCPDEGLPLTMLTTKINAMNIRDFNRWEHFIAKCKSKKYMYINIYT